MLLKRMEELKSAVYNCVCTNSVEQIHSTEALLLTHQLLQEVLDKKSRVYVIGNGGSASIASHMVIDLMNVLKIPAQTLDDSSIMSCVSNDYGYENSFLTPLKTLLHPNDLLIAISSSGSSSNILKAVEFAREKEISIVTFSGFKPTNPLRFMGSINYWIESEEYGIVEIAHSFILHSIIDLWDQLSSNNKESNTETILSYAK